MEEANKVKDETPDKIEPVADRNRPSATDNASFTGGSVTTINQAGGQVAHSITNVMQPPTFAVRLGFEVGTRSMQPGGGKPKQVVDTFVVKVANVGLVPCHIRAVYFCAGPHNGSQRVSVRLPTGPYRDYFDQLVYGHYCSWGRSQSERSIMSGKTGSICYPVPFLCADLYRQGLKVFPSQVLVVDEVDNEYLGTVPVDLQALLSAYMALPRVTHPTNFSQEPRSTRLQPTFCLLDFPRLSE